MTLSELALISEEMRKQLAGAEQAISGKLDSGAFDKWQAGELARLLAGKQPAGNYALSSELESHKRATDSSFEALANHPLTVDSNGYWRIWSVKDNQYVTTEYQSRGRDGEPGAKGADGKDAGRYLGRATRLNTSISRNYRAEESRSWETANEGDYVYLTISDGDWEKGNYYIVRERTTKTVWELYDIKGHTPVINWDGTRLIIDDLDPVDLRGHDGQDGDKGDRGPKGDKGDKPDPEEVLHTDRFGKLLSSEVTKQVKPVSDNLSTVSDILTTATNNITDLKKVALTTEMRTNLDYLTNSLQVLRSGDNSLAGLKLQRHIALSGDGVNVSAYIASKPMEAVLKAGITDFGKPTEREEVAICHDGTGHIGNLYFTGNRIDFRTGLDDAPYLSIGNEDNQFIDNFLATARLDDIPVTARRIDLAPSTPNTTSYEQTVDVANDGTRLTVSIGDLNVETYNGATTRLTLDGEVLAEWEGVVDIIEGSGGGVNIKPQTIRKPYKASNLSYERVVKAGNHKLRLEIVRPNSNAKATIRGLQVRRLYDTGRQQSVLTKSGLRLFGSPDRYLDVDYRQTYVDKSGFSYTREDNDYTVRIKGGAKVDKLTVEELDMPGVPLCGASFNENGGQEKAFGKYANKRGMSRAQAEYDYGMAAFKVYHSIGNTNYIPIVQVSGWNSGDINWSLTPRVYNITSEYFVVRILSNNDNPQRKAISYVAYKTQ